MLLSEPDNIDYKIFKEFKFIVKIISKYKYIKF